MTHVTEAQCLAALNTLVEATLTGVTCIKGNPAFERPDFTAPKAAIWWVASPPETPERISSANDMAAMSFGLAVFAANEPALNGYVAAIRSMLASNNHVAIDGRQVRLRATSLDRFETESITTTDAQRYALSATIQMTQE